MGEFVERYRYWIGSALLVLILAGGAFLLWRENKWKPDLESRLDALQTEFDSLKASGISSDESAQASDVNPSDLISQSQGTAPAASATGTASTKTPTKTSSKTATTASKPAATSPTPATPTSTSGKPPLPATPININTASAYELTALPGIGTVTAQSIIDYRNAHGPFTSIQGLDNVKNIGTATINKIKNYITI